MEASAVTVQEPDDGRGWLPIASRPARLTVIGVLVLALLVVLGGIQAASFYYRFTPRIEAANALYSELLTEKARGDLYRGIEMRLAELEASVPEGDEPAVSFLVALERFHDDFMTSPYDAVEALRAELPVLVRGAEDPDASIERVRHDLDRLQQIYADPFRDLLDGLERPPIYMWPTAAWLAGKSGYRHAVTLNRALYLAQVGEIGTARVLLTGLHASTDDPVLLGLANYTLGRLQFELLRARPEAEFYTQSVHYLRESLKADPDAPLARRFFDYLLSLSQTTAVPRAGEGTPTAPSEGEGAAISPDRRKF